VLRKREKTNMRFLYCPKLTGIYQNTLYILHTHKQEVFMKKRVCFTVSDEVLKKLAELAKKENRSMSSMIEQLIRSAK